MKNCFKSMAFWGSLVTGFSGVVFWLAEPSKTALRELVGADHLIYRVAAPFLEKAGSGGQKALGVGISATVAGTMKRLFSEDGDLYSHPKLPGKNKPTQGVIVEYKPIEVSPDIEQGMIEEIKNNEFLI